MICSNGLILRSISRTVCGAAANHFCAGSDMKFTKATRLPRMVAMISATIIATTAIRLSRRAVQVAP